MRHGIPENFETDFDEKLLEELREEHRREKEKGGPKVYRKGTTVSSVYAYALPSAPSADDSIEASSSSTSISPSVSFDADNHDSSAKRDKPPSQKKREIQKISLENDEMTVAQFLVTSGSGKVSKTHSKDMQDTKR